MTIDIELDIGECPESDINLTVLQYQAVIGGLLNDIDDDDIEGFKKAAAVALMGLQITAAQLMVDLVQMTEEANRDAMLEQGLTMFDKCMREFSATAMKHAAEEQDASVGISD